MKKYFVKVIAVVLPFFVVLGFLELRLSEVDTHYRTKSIAMANKSQHLEVLVMGSSNAYYNINPALFSAQGYNLAFNAQSMYYDEMLIRKYIASLPHLKLVILPAIYFTMGTTLPGSSQSWRENFYSSYFHIKPESEKNNSFFLLTKVFHPQYFSKIALFGSALPGIIKSNFKMKIDYDPENSGWYNSRTLAVEALNSQNGETAAKAQEPQVQVSAFKKNLEFWGKAIDLLKKRGIKVAIIRMPADDTYYRNLNQEKFSLMKSDLVLFARNKGVFFRDYSGDTRFNYTDYTFMVDHMNPTGATKFSKILNQDLVKNLKSI